MARENKQANHAETDAAAWERGCKADPIRNQFLIPAIARHFQDDKPNRILDIGTGTGYIPRMVDVALSYRPHWTLVDLNPSRMALAQGLKPESMALDAIAGDALTQIDSFAPFDAVLLTFTLLEFRELNTILSQVSNAINAGGVLILALPDLWRDVLGDQGSVSTANSLLDGAVEIPKTDKFTGTAYPFFGRRIEHVIAHVLRLKFWLEWLEQGGPNGEAFLLFFRKCGGHRV
jgi:SAM-dependent methyltransferase